MQAAEDSAQKKHKSKPVKIHCHWLLSHCFWKSQQNSHLFKISYEHSNIHRINIFIWHISQLYVATRKIYQKGKKSTIQKIFFLLIQILCKSSIHKLQKPQLYSDSRLSVNEETLKTSEIRQISNCPSPKKNHSFYSRTLRVLFQQEENKKSKIEKQHMLDYRKLKEKRKTFMKALFYKVFSILKNGNSSETNTLSVHPRSTYWSEKNEHINKKKKNIFPISRSL